MSESTESLTKFLRNKNTSIENILISSKRILDPNDLLFLPNAERFLLDLIADRLSQNNAFSLKFKMDEQFWSLFHLVWIRCNSNSQLVAMRSKLLSNLKLGEIFSQLISDIDDRGLFSNESYLTQVFIMFNLIIENIRLGFSQDQNLNLVKELTNNIVSNQYSDSLTLKLVQIIFKVFKLNNSNTSKYDTKHVKEFSTFVLPNLLVIIKQKLIFSQPAQTDMESLIVETLFRKDTLANILENIEFFLNSPSSDLTSLEFNYLLSLVIPKVKITDLEEIYKKIIESYPAYSGDLLKEITSMNKTLSTNFLSSLVDKELKSESPNLQVICQAIKRNSEVGLKFHRELIKLCIQNESQYDLIERFFDCYVNAREIPSFAELWSKAIVGNEKSILVSDKFINYTSSKLVTLSYNQLSSIVERLVQDYRNDSTSYPVALIAVSKGLLRGVSGSVPNAISKSLIQNLSQLKPLLLSALQIEGQHSYKLYFYILSLFDLELIEEEFDVQKQLLKSHVDDDYYYYSYFRIVEQNIDSINDTDVNKFIKYFEKSSNAFKLRIFKRWMVLIDISFNNSQIDKLISNLFGSKTIDSSDIDQILNHPFMADQSKIMSSIIDYISKHSKSIHYLANVSLYIYTKKQRQDILELILSKVLSKKLPVQEFASIAEKLLVLPTFKTKLETDVASLIKLVQIDTEKKYILNIIKTIFKNYIQRQENSTDYILNLFKKLEKHIAKGGDNLFIDLELGVLLLDQTLDVAEYEKHRQTLLKLWTSKCIMLLKDDITENEAYLLLKYLSSIASQFAVDEDEIKSIDKQISEKYKQSENVQSALYDLATKCKTYSATYILSLYVAMNNSKNYTSMNKFVELLSCDADSYISLWVNVLQSMDVDIYSSHSTYIDILCSFMMTCKKPENVNNIQKLQQLTVTSLSEIFTVSLNKSIEIDVESYTHLLHCLRHIATSKGWLLTQYSVEMIMPFISDISRTLKASKNLDSEFYILLTQAVSAFVLYQRYRFKQRYHLVILVFVTLLNLLMARSNTLSSECGLAYERLMSNLCEPSGNLVSTASSNEEVSKDVAVSNALAQLKSNLRKNLHILLFNYIKFYLQYQVDLKIKAHLDTSIYMVLDLFTTTELHFINKSLDNQGRVVFKTLYDDYQKYYKWKEE